MELEIIILGEVSQVQKDKQRMFSHVDASLESLDACLYIGVPREVRKMVMGIRGNFLKKDCKTMVTGQR